MHPFAPKNQSYRLIQVIRHNVYYVTAFEIKTTGGENNET